MLIPCSICRRYGASNHHLLPKSVYPEFRNEPMNLIPLCTEHHTYGSDTYCAHGDENQRREFNAWMQRNRPEQFAFMVKHSRRPILLPDNGKFVE